MAGSAASNSLTGRNNELPPEAVIFGQSPAMQAVRQKVEKVAGTNVPVLIQGESGTGKEILARLIHARSPWNSGPFVKVNCAAIPGTLLESELFGYQKGAFTGAYSSKPGRVEMAHRGTLFLDEIAELDSSLQAKLLQVLQDGQFCRIGDQEDKRVDARVICATNHQLEREIENGSFRPDLYYRINVICINMPPLWQRREDIPILADHFLNLFSQRFGRNAPPFSKKVLRFLIERDWPGNIRETENWVARYVILGCEEAVYGDDLEKRPAPFAMQAAADGSIPLKRITKDATVEMERNLILKVLSDNHWNRRKTAEVLKISYRALLNKMRQAGLGSGRSGTANKTMSGSAAFEESPSSSPARPSGNVPA